MAGRVTARDDNTLVANVADDLRYASRLMLKSPGFSLVAIITLALGIGPNSAIFSVVNSVLLRPLPYKDPGRLVAVYCSASDTPHFGSSPPDFRTVRQQNRTFDSLSAFYTTAFSLAGDSQPERLLGLTVSVEYFRTFGVQPLMGRTFVPEDEQWGRHQVVALSEILWRNRFHADPEIVGQTLRLNNEQYKVIGVIPKTFLTSAKTQLWAPMAWAPKDNRNSHEAYFLDMAGKLKPNASKEQALADLNSIMLSIAQQFPENKGIGADVQPLQETIVGNVRPALFMLLMSVGLILLMACVNMACLLLARSARRQKEVAIRFALGIQRRRLIQQFLTESVLLAMIAGALGLLLAYGALRLLPLAGNSLPRAQEIHLDTSVLVFTFVISIVTGLLFGLAPALRNSQTPLSEALKEGGRTEETGRGSSRTRSALVVAEIAIALVVLISAGLVLKSLQRLLHVDAGFDPAHVLTFRVDLPQSYSADHDPMRDGAPPRVAAFFQQLVQRLEALPGAKAAGAISDLPLQGERWSKQINFPDRPAPASLDEVPSVQYRAVGGHFFESLKIGLLNGRLFNEQDTQSSRPIAIVNYTFARRFWPNQNPVGKEITLFPPENLIPPGQLPSGYHIPRVTVVGVVADAHYGGLAQQVAPLVYAPFVQNDWTNGMSIAVRVNGDPAAFVTAARHVVFEIDKNQPIANVTSMDEMLTASVAQPRLQTLLLSVFGALAVVLTAIGVYGLISYSVVQRTSEIGIRMALGADRFSVLRTFLSEALSLAGLGLVIGLACSVIFSRILQSLLFAVRPTDPGVFALIAVFLFVVVFLASYIPARRATKVEPVIALRHQ
jgi:putative ABC transport system permease protein